jgi:hypothetical protein
MRAAVPRTWLAIAGVTVVLAAATWTFVKKASTPELAVPQGGLAAGGTTAVPVVFDPHGVRVASLQFDIVWDSKFLSLEVRGGEGLRKSGKELAVSSPAPGAARVLIFGLNRNLLEGGVIATLMLSARGDAPARTFPISFFNGSAADPDGGSVPLAMRNGSVAVGAP